VTEDFSNAIDEIPSGLFRLGVEATTRIPTGHIHRTWRVVDHMGRAFAVQSIDRRVFPDVRSLADNAEAIVSRLEAGGISYAAPVGLGPADSRVLFVDGQAWRATRWVDGRRPNPMVVDEVQATSRAFGRFASALASLDGLHEVIPSFHDPYLRLDRLHSSMSTNDHGRVGDAADAADHIGELMAFISPALDARRKLPVRVAHNDAKIDNAIIGADGVITVIDLDTVMPGSIVDDIGELIRSVIRPVEDQAMPGGVSLEMVTSIVGGFTGGFGDISSSEAEYLPWAGLVLTVENAMRFLTDFIDGDRYFAVDGPTRNLRRAVAQIELADQLVEAHDSIAAAVGRSLVR